MSGNTLNNSDDSLQSEKQSFRSAFNEQQTDAQNAAEKSSLSDTGLKNELFDFLLSFMSKTVLAIDNRGIIIYCNKHAEQMLGKSCSEIIGKNIDETVVFVNEQTLEPYGSVMEILINRSGRMEIRCIILGKEGETRAVTVRSDILRKEGKAGGIYVLVIEDCFYREMQEEELLRTRKLESVGLLAGGIAHDFNNILTGIITNLFMARMSAYQNTEACQLIAEAEKAAFKATTLTKQLLTFSQSGAPIKESVNIRQLIEETVGFSLSGSNVDYILKFDENISPVEVDRGQIDQVVNNLVINAAQAMPEGGTVTVSVENRTIMGGYPIEEQRSASRPLPLPDGDYVKVSVIDEGPGIPKKHINKIFDPYFTTKPDSTGLGLTIVYSILKKHGGYIEVESQQGSGARFSFYLPSAEDNKTPEDTPETSVCVKASGNVLVMDDDVTIRTVIEKLLKKSGYNVVCVSNGFEALQTYKEAFNRKEPFLFAIMDLTIPGGMGGKETVIKLKEFDNKAKVIVFSGYSNDPILNNFKKYGFDGVLKKPFSADELFNLIKTLTGAESK